MIALDGKKGPWLGKCTVYDLVPAANQLCCTHLQALPAANLFVTVPFVPRNAQDMFLTLGLLPCDTRGIPPAGVWEDGVLNFSVYLRGGGFQILHRLR